MISHTPPREGKNPSTGTERSADRTGVSVRLWCPYWLYQDGDLYTRPEREPGDQPVVCEPSGYYSIICDTCPALAEFSAARGRPAGGEF